MAVDRHRDAGAALSGLNWTATLQDSLRDKSPAELRLMNLGVLTNNMGIATEAANAFLNNNAISPTTQTLIVAALAQLGNIPGQGEFILQAANPACISAGMPTTSGCSFRSSRN